MHGPMNVKLYELHSGIKNLKSIFFYKFPLSLRLVTTLCTILSWHNVVKLTKKYTVYLWIYIW